MVLISKNGSSQAMSRFICLFVLLGTVSGDVYQEHYLKRSWNGSLLLVLVHHFLTFFPDFDVEVFLGTIKWLNRYEAINQRIFLLKHFDFLRMLLVAFLGEVSNVALKLIHREGHLQDRFFSFGKRVVLFLGGCFSCFGGV